MSYPWGRFHKELGLVLSTRPNLELPIHFVYPLGASPKLGLVLTLCEIDPLIHSLNHRSSLGSLQPVHY